ncbi:MAG: phospholipase [Desulfuromonas sp.]|nr:MAG: phospholipase [Desulfuromonas sp.]
MTLILLLLFICLGWLAWRHVGKLLPDGLDMRGETHSIAADRVRFLHDLTTTDGAGTTVREQEIFTTLFALIGQAEHYVLIDFFLLNDQQGRRGTPSFRPLAEQLVDHLCARKNEIPGLQIDVLSDPINSVYGSAPSPLFERLRAAGINLITTDLVPLRDSNPLYSVWWRLLLRRIPDRGRYLPHPFDASADRISLTGWLTMANFKANHRKVTVLDHDGELLSLVTSANPHAASSSHSNIALLINDRGLAEDIYRSEQAVAGMSGGCLHPLPNLAAKKVEEDNRSRLKVSLVTEARIGAAIAAAIHKAQRGDIIRIAMFYLADRDITNTLLAAAKRGASVMLILDPNRDAFGYEKNGVPNRPVAAELIRQGLGQIAVRWYRTHGEQFHTKLVMAEYRSNATATLILGSANLTRRNIGNYNLESNLEVTGNSSTEPFIAVKHYYDRLWNNGDYTFTLPYSAMADPSRLKYFQYLVQEELGLGSF